METHAKTTLLGRYQIERQLGRGAMGVVYLASDPVIGRRIALKVLRLDLPGAEKSAERLRSRFQREAQSAGILSHPNIVTVYDAIEETDDGALCIAMEYVEGTNLSDILRRPEPLALDFALDIVAQIADALDYAHGQGVIHRDIKPANVIVTPNGRAKITDFGIAHLIDSALSDDLRFLGTPSYMAPERIEGREVDHRADLFSLGVVLYQLLTRHMPFKGSSVADLTRSIARDAPAPPERFVPDVSPELRGILMKSLEKNPDKRYQKAAAMAIDLRAVLGRIAALHQTQPLGVTAPQPVAAAPLTTPVAPRAAVASALAGRGFVAALVAVALAAIGGIWWASRGGEEPDSGAGTAEKRSLAAYAPVLAEGVARLAAGDAIAARELLRSAEMLGPDSRRARLWRQLAEDRIERDRLGRREIELAEAVEMGRAALARGRLGPARSALAAAREIDPEHELVVDLASRLWLAQQPVRREDPAPVEPVTPPPPIEIAPQVVPLEIAPVSTVSTVDVDFFSQVSRGVLTMYRGNKQIFREAFRFVERRRLLPPKAATGSLSRRLEVPAGELSLRVYLSLPGRETQVLRLESDLEGGATQVLRLRVAADGEFTASLR
ncbi:MAG: protein kinase [Acidobacteria bacterium]|nr:protein kinase [Acidobacteriota bacterium]